MTKGYKFPPRDGLEKWLVMTEDRDELSKFAEERQLKVIEAHILVNASILVCKE